MGNNHPVKSIAGPNLTAGSSGDSIKGYVTNPQIQLFLQVAENLIPTGVRTPNLKHELQFNSDNRRDHQIVSFNRFLRSSAQSFDLSAKETDNHVRV